jgi:hypothetical protein
MFLLICFFVCSIYSVVVLLSTFICCSIHLLFHLVDLPCQFTLLLHFIVPLCYHTLLFCFVVVLCCHPLLIHLIFMPCYFDLRYLFGPCCSTLLAIMLCLLFCALILLDSYYPPPHPNFFCASLGMVNFKFSFPSVIKFSPSFLLKKILFVKTFHYVYMFHLHSLYFSFLYSFLTYCYMLWIVQEF